jgi:hypothetical protein
VTAVTCGGTGAKRASQEKIVIALSSICHTPRRRLESLLNSDAVVSQTPSEFCEGG